MASTYEVDIPGVRAAEFEEAVKEFGGNIVSKKADLPSEAQEVWDMQLSEARRLVEAVRTPLEEPYAKQREVFLRHFLERGQVYLDYERDVKVGVTDEQLLGSVADILDEKLTERIHEGIRARQELRGFDFVYRTGGGKAGLIPMEVVTFIRKYGLSDGKPVQNKELEREYNLPDGRVSKLSRRTANKVIMGFTLRGLVSAQHKMRFPLF